MNLPDPLYPILMPATWEPAGGTPATHLNVPSEDPRVPWVTFGSLSPSGPVIVEIDSDKDASIENLNREAMENLTERPASWRRVKSRGGARRSKMLAFLEDPLAAERILDSEFVSEAQAKLNTELLAVGIPRRGVIVAIDGRQPEESLLGFGAFNLAEFHSGQTEPITSLTFLFNDGELAGIANFGSE